MRGHVVCTGPVPDRTSNGPHPTLLVLVGRTSAWRRAAPPSKHQRATVVPPPRRPRPRRARTGHHHLSHDSTLLDVAEESSPPNKLAWTRGWPYKRANRAPRVAARFSGAYNRAAYCTSPPCSTNKASHADGPGPIFAVRNAASRLSSSNLACSGSRLDSFKAARPTLALPSASGLLCYPRRGARSG